MADELGYIRGSCGNNLAFTDELLDNMVRVMIKHGSEDFWKVLKYPSKDALAQPNLTEIEKVLLVKSGAIQRKAYNNDISTEAHNELRIYVHRWDGKNVDNYDVRIGFDVISHNSLIELNDGKTTGMLMVHEILDLFNGSIIGKNIGKFTIDGMSGGIVYYNSEYQGYKFTIRGKS
jgi:hypothetical protein